MFSWEMKNLTSWLVSWTCIYLLNLGDVLCFWLRTSFMKKGFCAVSSGLWSQHFLCLVTLDDHHHSSNNWKHWSISTLGILWYYFFKLLSSFTSFKEKKNNPNEAAANRHAKDKISWETQRGNFISFLNIVRKITCYLREKRNKLKKKVNKGRAQLTIMKWNTVQRLTWMSKDSRND